VAELRERTRDLTVEQLAIDFEAIRAGGRLFMDNCSQCHGRRGEGMRTLGAPNLLDADWLYGGDPKAIMTSILDGRQGVMPPFGAAMDAKAVTNLAHYVAGLGGQPLDALKAALGKSQYQACAACHGPAGKGNIALGAPNLSDRTWLYGGDIPAIEATIRNGRSGVMPAWRDRLGEDGARLVAAWIYGNANGIAPAR
jgi:cytochrome c oxidase cbb3-type subunit 3